MSDPPAKACGLRPLAGRSEQNSELNLKLNLQTHNHIKEFIKRSLIENFNIDFPRPDRGGLLTVSKPK